MANETEIIRAKELRVSLDTILQTLKDYRSDVSGMGIGEVARNASLSVTHLEDSIMRLGMVLKYLATENPYPNSYDPTNATVEPTADNLKM